MEVNTYMQMLYFKRIVKLLRSRLRELNNYFIIVCDLDSVDIGLAKNVMK